MFFGTIVLALLFQSVPSCQIPPGITIQYAEDPCWTIEWVRSQYKEAETDVGFSRWLTDKPYSPVDIENITLNVVEHPDLFDNKGSSVMGVFKVSTFSVLNIYQIEYSKKHALIYRNLIMRHELGHMREFEEEIKWSPFDAFFAFGWWHFGHGDLLDPLVKTVNFVTRWFYRGLPENHSYWPGLIGHPPLKGSPGTDLESGLPPKSQFDLIRDGSEFTCILSVPTIPKN